MRYSFITVVRGQEGWLAQTLRRNLNALRDADAEVVLVDYASPNDTEGLARRIAEPELEAGKLVYVEVKEAPQWNLSRARNVGHRCAQGDFLCALDVDHLVGSDFIGCLDYDLATGAQVVGFFPGGRVAVQRDLFAEVRGYDESFRGWGYEAQDLYDRARLASGGKARRRPLSQADRLDVAMAWRNGQDSDAPGVPPNETYKANSLLAQASIRDKRYATNPGGYGVAKVFVNFNTTGTELT